MYPSITNPWVSGRVPQGKGKGEEKNRGGNFLGERGLKEGETRLKKAWGENGGNR